jgi:hypothetical protein
VPINAEILHLLLRPIKGRGRRKILNCLSYKVRIREGIRVLSYSSQSKYSMNKQQQETIR